MGDSLTLRQFFQQPHLSRGRPLPRFPKTEPDKVRPIDDGTRSGANDATTMHETPYMPPANTVVDIAFALAPFGQPVLALDDVHSAYRQLPSRSPEVTSVMYYDPAFLGCAF
ncbi:hypothetical protein NFJ02_43g110510 [Pycnococcus provasolii]